MIAPQILTLTKPITHNETTYTELVFTREMQMRDMFAMDDQQGGTRRTCALYASMAGVPFDVVAQFTNGDMAGAARAVAALSGKPSAGAPGAAAGIPSAGTT
jgi:Phage tail assembly chaperone proteins, E, or 41 or 14